MNMNMDDFWDDISDVVPTSTIRQLSNFESKNRILEWVFFCCSLFILI